MPFPPASVTSRAVVSIVLGLSPVLRPVTYTVAPCSPKPIATPRPMPRLAPVTIAICPSNDPMLSSAINLSEC